MLCRCNAERPKRASVSGMKIRQRTRHGSEQIDRQTEAQKKPFHVSQGYQWKLMRRFFFATMWNSRGRWRIKKINKSSSVTDSRGNLKQDSTWVIAVQRSTAVPDSIPSLHWLILHASVAFQHQPPLDRPSRHSRRSRRSSLLCRTRYRDTSWCALTKSWPTLALESLILEQIHAVSLIYIRALHKPLSDGTWRQEIPQTGTVKRLI